MPRVPMDYGRIEHGAMRALDRDSDHAPFEFNDRVITIRPSVAALPASRDILTVQTLSFRPTNYSLRGWLMEVRGREGAFLASRFRHVEGVFGDWDAPVTDGLPEVPTPVGLLCPYCNVQIRPGDNGAMTLSLDPHHRECSLREVMGGIGHLVDHDKYCAPEGLGPDAGLTRRQSALLVWDHYNGETITDDDLEALRWTWNR